MKKMFLMAIAGLAALTLTSCTGSYKKVQDEASINSPVSCIGYHVKRAQWNYVDDLGQNLFVTGRCAKGKKHGQFQFFVDGKQVATTKFSSDQEVKSVCYVGGKSRLNLVSCLTKNANDKAYEAKKAESQADVDTASDAASEDF